MGNDNKRNIFSHNEIPRCKSLYTIYIHIYPNYIQRMHLVKIFSFFIVNVIFRREIIGSFYLFYFFLLLNEGFVLLPKNVCPYLANLYQLLVEKYVLVKSLHDFIILLILNFKKLTVVFENINFI